LRGGGSGVGEQHRQSLSVQPTHNPSPFPDAITLGVMRMHARAGAGAGAGAGAACSVQLLLVGGVMSSCRRRRCRRHVPSPSPSGLIPPRHHVRHMQRMQIPLHFQPPHTTGRSPTEPARLMTSASASTSTRPFRQGRPCEICTAHSSRSTLQARADSRSCRSDCPRGTRYFLSFLLRRPESATSTTSNSPPRFPWNKFGDCSGLPSPAPSALPLVSRRRNAHGKILHSPPARLLPFRPATSLPQTTPAVQSTCSDNVGLPEVGTRPTACPPGRPPSWSRHVSPRCCNPSCKVRFAPRLAETLPRCHNIPWLAPTAEPAISCPSAHLPSIHPSAVCGSTLA
jgi:hypothetical protein